MYPDVSIIAAQGAPRAKKKRAQPALAQHEGWLEIYDQK